jgi:catechol 2,3-dioxygenase-like lactoylglutathione lyase family enzyme
MDSTLEREQALLASPSGLRTADMKLEVVVIPVADVERAKRFYEQLGWRLDADFAKGDAFRVLQFTPPGSPCSIHFGTGLTQAAPGSASGLFLIVSDIEAAHAELQRRGIGVSAIFHRPSVGEQPRSGLHPQRHTYFSHATFSDPDGNTWLLQEVTTRFPGRVDAEQATFSSPAELAGAMRRAEAAHGVHEKRTGVRDTEWPAWYAQHMFSEQLGRPLPT